MSDAEGRPLKLPEARTITEYAKVLLTAIKADQEAFADAVDEMDDDDLLQMLVEEARRRGMSLGGEQ